MSIKIKYAADGSKEAEVELDQAFLQSKDNRDGYMVMHEFLTGVMNGSQRKRPSKDDDEGGNRPHNKSLPHFKTDRKLAKFIIDNGGLKHLHGVHYINKQQVFFFDKSPAVQAIVERYNEHNDLQSDASHVETPTKSTRPKRSKKHKNKTAGQDQPNLVERRTSEVCVSDEQTDGADAEKAEPSVTSQETEGVEPGVMAVDK